jgi:hypothetical protein
MNSLTERIRVGEAAIARAKAMGRDVPQWEQHLERLKREAAEDPVGTEPRPADQPQPNSFENDAGLPVHPGQITDDDLEHIKSAWDEIGLPQTPQRVTEHWGAIAKWLNTSPRTNRYIDKEQLTALREEIIAALLVASFGTTRERAEELTVGLISVERLPWPPEREPRGCELLNTESQSEKTKAKKKRPTAVPFLDTHGNLVIPIDCDPKYRWWDGGQSIAETLNEINTQVTRKFMKL